MVSNFVDMCSNLISIVCLGSFISCEGNPDIEASIPPTIHTAARIDKEINVNSNLEAIQVVYQKIRPFISELYCERFVNREGKKIKTDVPDGDASKIPKARKDLLKDQTYFICIFWKSIELKNLYLKERMSDLLNWCVYSTFRYKYVKCDVFFDVFVDSHKYLLTMELPVQFLKAFSRFFDKFVPYYVLNRIEEDTVDKKNRSIAKRLCNHMLISEDVDKLCKEDRALDWDTCFWKLQQIMDSKVDLLEETVKNRCKPLDSVKHSERCP